MASYNMIHDMETIVSSELILIKPQLCTGCRLCEIACSLKQTGLINPERSRIRIFRCRHEENYLPVSCQHCDEAPCMAVCPREAIYREQTSPRVMVNYDLCISCRLCMAACPFGAIRFDVPRGKIFKCNLCDGNPACVSFCVPGALSFIDTYKMSYDRARYAASFFRSINQTNAKRIQMQRAS